MREFKLEGENVHFLLSENDANKNIVLKVGPSFVKRTFFTDEYPSEKEIEQALNHIEYEFTAQKELKNSGEKLRSENQVLAEMLGVDHEETLSRKKLEETFDKFVDCACGEPAFVLGIDYSSEKLATIIVVRTIMYYLIFEEITIINK